MAAGSSWWWRRPNVARVHRCTDGANRCEPQQLEYSETGDAQSFVDGYVLFSHGHVCNTAQRGMGAQAS